jgi:chemotaxis protein CheX
METHEIIRNLTSEACLSLFSDYSLPLQPAQTSEQRLPPELLYCSVIGFTGDLIRGTLVLATTSEPLGRTTPVQGGSLSEWVAELSNQLLGRVKRQLHDRGVMLLMSTPIVLRGKHLRPMPSKEAEPLTFVCEGGCVCVWMDAVLAPDVDLTQLQAEDGSMGEGETMLF